jgi:hypothetical protein
MVDGAGSGEQRHVLLIAPHLRAQPRRRARMRVRESRRPIQRGGGSDSIDRRLDMLRTYVRTLFAALALAAVASPARAADPSTEIGASLVNATIGFGDNDVSTIGIPSGGFGILQPGVYASFFLGPFFAVEPQVGLIWASSNGHSEHVVNFVGQVDYFLAGANGNSPYLFGSAGVIDVSGSGATPKSVSGGAGYRMLAGDRLAFRFDGRVTHFTENGGNAVGFTLSFGGVF